MMKMIILNILLNVIRLEGHFSNVEKRRISEVTAEYVTS